MKRKLCTALIVIAGMTGLILQGVDVQIENATPFKIVKYQLGAKKGILADMNVSIPAQSKMKISFPEKNVEDLYFIFDNGDKHSPIFVAAKDLRSIKFTYKNSFSLFESKRGKRTKYPVGQIRISLAKEVKSVSVCPLDKRDEWKNLSVVNAKKKLYAAPVPGKYKIRIESKIKSKPEVFFSGKEKKGYDFSQIASFSVYYTGIESNVAEAGDDDDDDDDE